LAAAAGLALAAGLAGFFAGDARRESTPVAAVSESVPESRGPTALPTAHRALPAMVPTQFVLNAPRASRVALVGDFNAWDARVTHLARAAANGIWTVTVPLSAGRHTYAFMVDDTVWTLDPRAAKTQDLDFGTASSVVLVGTP
jgi:1,4-alpha-glucan branching enzyme